MLKLRTSWQYVFFIVLVGLLSLGQLQRVQITSFIAVYLHDIVITLWVLLLLFTHFTLVIQTVQSNWRKLFSPILCSLVGAVGVSWLLAWQKGQFSLEALLLTGRFMMYLGWAWLVSLTKPVGQQFWQLGFIGAGLLIASFGFLQYLFFPDTRFLSILGWDDHYYRLISTPFDPNFTGLLLVITLVWLLSLSSSWWNWFIHFKSVKQQHRYLSHIRNILVLTLIVAITLTFSRASYLSLVIGLTTIWLKQGMTSILSRNSVKFMALVFIAGISVIGLGWLTTGEGTNLLRTSTIQARLINSQSWLTSLAPHEWLVGRGLFVAPDEARTVAMGISADTAQLPDNIVVLLISSFGMVGGLLLITHLYQQHHHLIASGSTVAILAAVLFHSLFNNSLLQPFVLLFVLGKLVSDHLISGRTR